MSLTDLDTATCSDGAPSARNLIVTVFGDVLVLSGPGRETTVQELASILADFGVNERLVRTSLTRLANDGLLAVRPDGRRSFYRVAPEAIDLFAEADERIYRVHPDSWDGYWTLVVLDGAESTPGRRAALRHELGSLGLGVIAPNVMGSPIVAPSVVAEVVDRAEDFEHVLVIRSEIVAGAGLARRSLALEPLAERYAELADRLAAYDDALLARLDDSRAAKLRLLVVSTFRRLVLADPMLPAELLPPGWAGDRARREAARVYTAVVERSDRHLGAATDPTRFRSG